MKLTVYLADLTHDGCGKLAVDMMPYNIGLVASYAKKHLADQVEIRLFKYVQPLLAALRKSPPDILGCSNYVWNSHLSEFVFEEAKKRSPRTLTVLGGTNYPYDAKGQLEFLKTRPATDFHIFYEGEVAFLNLLRAAQECPDPESLRERPVDGLQSVSRKTEQLISGNPVTRLKNLDDVPSPYATGLLDEFFDGKLLPLLETNRGCPFTCNFCNAGDSYYTKVNMFSLEHLEKELSYIAPRTDSLGIGTLMLADNNFGMYPRDADLCRILKRLQEEHGWPIRILSTTGKNSKERIIEATEILGTSMSINMSVQSMNQDVLRNIKRQNVRLDTYKQVNEALLRQGRMQKAEMIVPLPGETFESFTQGLRELMDTRAQLIYSYTLQLLYGTDYKDPEYRKKWGYEGKWRLVPLNFGEYAGQRIFDAEEVAVNHNSISFEEYLKIRVVALLTEVMYNDYQCWEIVKYLSEYGLAPFDWILRTLSRLDQAPESIRSVVKNFIRDTREELWDSEEALFEFYRKEENYQRLLKGEAGHNVVFTHKGIMISRHTKDWLSFILGTCFELISEKGADADQVREELRELERFLSAKLEGVLQKDGNTREITLEMRYDILGWLKGSGEKPLREYRSEPGIPTRFYFSEKQMKERGEYERLYGSDRIGLARIFARNPSLHMLYRRVESLGSSETLEVRSDARPPWNN